MSGLKVMLRAAIRANAADARAPYYLGNLLYDWQPEEATKLWEASAKIDPNFAITHRNLAIAYMHRKQGRGLQDAIAQMEKAVSLDRKYASHFTELDELYEQAGVAIDKRLPLFEKNRQTVLQRDDSSNRWIALKIAAGKYDEAIELMKSKTFAAVEGANLNVPEHWTDAHLLRGQARLNAKRYKEALADFDAALHLPANLPAGLGFAEGSGGAARAAEIAWWTGEAYEATGDREKASAAWQRGATAGSPERRWRRGPMTPSSQSYYQALCLQKVGQNEKATAQLKGLVDAGRGMLGDSARLRVARGHYLAGLGYVGLNDREKGRAELQEAVTMSPDLVGARSALGWLTNE